MKQEEDRGYKKREGNISLARAFIFIFIIFKFIIIFHLRRIISLNGSGYVKGTENI